MRFTAPPAISRSSCNLLLPLAMVLILFCGSGANCLRQFRFPSDTYGPPAPRVLSVTPTLDEVITAVNNNAGRIQSFATNNARINVPGTTGMPTLSGNIAMSRPGMFRLRAGTALLGPEVDMGSNDTLYWVWINRSQPRAVYVGQHDQFAQSGARQIMPIEPRWLLAAFGLVEFDPTTQHQGPLPRPDGKLEIRSTLDTPSGQMTKVTVIDAARAWVLEQHVYDPTGTLLASAIARSHRYYPAHQVSLPQEVEIRLPPAQLAMSIDVGAAMINQLSGDPAQLWGLPHFEGYPVVSLDTMNGGPSAPTQGHAPSGWQTR